MLANPRNEWQPGMFVQVLLTTSRQSVPLAVRGALALAVVLDATRVTESENVRRPVALCDTLNGQACPDFGETVITAAWPLPDPAKFTGSTTERTRADMSSSRSTGVPPAPEARPAAGTIRRHSER
mgnify:CR=1 FL=1